MLCNYGDRRKRFFELAALARYFYDAKTTKISYNYTVNNIFYSILWWKKETVKGMYNTDMKMRIMKKRHGILALIVAVSMVISAAPIYGTTAGDSTDDKEIIFGTRIYVQILVLQGFVELSDVVKSGGIYSVRNAFATRLQQKYLKNIGHFSVIGTGECPFCYADFVSAVTLSSFSKVLLIASTRTCISK